MTPEGPPIQEQPNWSADDTNSELAIPPFPVVIIESPQDAKDRRDREQKSDQHEADDLAAQRKAADAADSGAATAERQIIPTWIQTGVAIIGTIALLITISYNIKATNAAIRSADLAEKSIAVTRDIGERQVRAYLDVTRMRVFGVEDSGNAKACFFIKNSGATPAKNVRIKSRLIWLESANDKLPRKAKSKNFSQRTVASGETFRTTLINPGKIDLDALRAISQGSIFLVLIVSITYEDVFRKTRRSIARGYAAKECAITGKGQFVATKKHNRSS